MKIAVFLNLVRWKNLLLITYVFILLKFQFFKVFNTKTNLTDFQFFLLLFSVLAIMAAGYIINDIFDIKTDEINKPNKVIVSRLISVEKAQNWYKILNVIGIGLGIILCLKIEKPTYSFIFICASLLLYYYSKKLKKIPFIGNLTIAFLISFSIFILAIFEMNVVEKSEINNFSFYSILILSGFAFIINIIREIVKDIEDVNGDNTLNLKTLPIIFGRKRIQYLASIFCLIPIGFLAYIILIFNETYKFLTIYLLFFSLIPLLYIFIKLRSVKKKKEFHQLSSLLKIIMFLGINSLLILSIFN